MPQPLEAVWSQYTSSQIKTLQDVTRENRREKRTKPVYANKYYIQFSVSGWAKKKEATKVLE